MLIAVSVFVIISLVELAMYLPFVWPLRKVLAALVLIVLAGYSGGLFMTWPNVATGLLLAINAYRVFNMLRVVEGRLQPQFLRHATFRTTYTLIGFQIFIAAIWLLNAVVKLSDHLWWLGLATAQLVAAGALLASTRRHLRTTLPPQIAKHLPDHDLPDVTICLPARNETQAMADCLRSLVASNYPKLEILVLDDCSQDRTSDIIRTFAHDGVRFIKGDEAPTNWLAKNWAYKRLLDESTGDVLLFCGVDTRFEPDSLRMLVETMLTKEKRMMSVMPQCAVPGSLDYRQSSLLQSARYAWELCLPRRLFRRPPVLSSCWVAEKSFLRQAGGFAAVSNKMVPESYFAGAAAKNDGYSFVRATNELRITSLKSFSEQWDTAVRTGYPQLHRKPELVLALSAAQITFLVLPFVLFAIALSRAQWSVATITGLAILCLLWVYVQVVRVTYGRFLFRSLLALPFAASLDICVRQYSMAKYEFSEVIWKGRNICMPVMQVIPKLPKV